MDLLSPAYRYFLEVAESRSIREASDRLRISQSAVSRQIIKLEDLLGYGLFERTARGVTLTSEGELLLRHLRETDQISEKLRTELDEIHGVQRGHVRIAVVEGFSVNNLPEVLGRFHALHPAVTLQALVKDSIAIQAGLLSDEYDLGVVYNPRQDELLIHESCDAPLMALVSSTHVLVGRECISLNELKNFPVIAPSSFGGSQEVFMAAQRHVKSDLHVILETNSANVAAAMLSKTDAVAVLSPRSAARYIDAGEIVAIPISENTLARGRLVVVSRLGRSLPSAANILASILSSSVRNMTTP